LSNLRYWHSSEHTLVSDAPMKYYCYDEGEFVRCYHLRVFCCKTCSTENCKYKCPQAKLNERCEQQISARGAIIILL